MKNYFILAFLLLAFSACMQSNTRNATKSNDEATISNVFSVVELLKEAPHIIDKEIQVSGMVNHVCSHSGRRCFLVDSLTDETIKVEAGGEIESFGKELIGLDLIVRGILKERRLMASEIDEWEVELVEEYGDIEQGGEKCASEMDNINSMRDWMKEHKKDYYAIYYLDGMSYEVVE